MKIRKKGFTACLFLLFIITSVSAQEIRMSEIASLEQVYGDTEESQNLLPMGDLGVEFGYVLYEAEITTGDEPLELKVENVRDYAAVYVDGKLQGRITDEHKKLFLKTSAGQHQLRLYAENIGRITYGPEILDNSKGLFGSITLNDEEIENWKMTPLLVKECEVKELDFTAGQSKGEPCFYKGTVNLPVAKDTHLDISGWGMGEAWVNGTYVGSYWEESSQQSIPVPASALVEGDNSVVLFELKDTGTSSARLVDKAIFKKPI